MLNVVAPPHRTDDEAALLTVVKQWRKFPWEPFLTGWCAAFHALVAVVLVAFPSDQVLTEGTRPVLDLAPRHVWAAVFLAIAAAVAYLREPRRRMVQGLVWLAVLLLGGMWLTAFFLAVLRGEGSAVGVAVWPFLYGPWVIVAYLSLGKR